MPTTTTADSWLAAQTRTSLVTTNQESGDVAFQRWYRFKEAFSPRFVAESIQLAQAMLGRPVQHCCDPFGGSGTTALTCQFLGIFPSTVEVNPFLADLIEAKLTSYDLEEVEQARSAVLDFMQRGSACKDAHECVDGFPGAPATFVEPGKHGRWIFDRDVANRILTLRRVTGEIQKPEIQRLFRVLLGSVLVKVSNVVVSGKGRRYRGESRFGRSTPADVDVEYASALTRSVEDLRAYNSRAGHAYSLVRGDARQMLSEINDVDLYLFSPPYPNSFDYTDIYNVELWGLGYLGSRADNHHLRHSTLRSHVQILRDFNAVTPHSPTLAVALEGLQRVEERLWNPHLPAMVQAYFADLMHVMRSACERLTQGGVIMMVVGDSRYAGIHVDVAQIVSEMAPSVDLRCKVVRPVRSMRTSAQQGGDFNLREWLLVLQRTSPLVRGNG